MIFDKERDFENEKLVAKKKFSALYFELQTNA